MDLSKFKDIDFTRFNVIASDYEGFCKENKETFECDQLAQIEIELLQNSDRIVKYAIELQSYVSELKSVIVMKEEAFNETKERNQSLENVIIALSHQIKELNEYIKAGVK